MRTGGYLQTPSLTGSAAASSTRAGLKMFRPSRTEMYSSAFCALTELPALVQRRGANAARPITPGTTPMMPPPTPVLAGSPVVEEPVARVFVESDRGHHRRDLRCQPGFEDLLAGQGIHAPGGDRGGHDGQLAGRHAERALPRVEVERHAPDRRRCGHSSSAARRSSLLLKLVAALRSVEFVDHFDLRAAVRSATNEPRWPATWPSASPVGRIIEQAEIAPAFTSGVEGWSFSSSSAMIELKGSPVGVGADLGEHLFGAVLVHRQDGGGDFRHRFDAEAVVGVADRHDCRPSARQTEMPKSVGGHVFQIGDVVGVLAALLLACSGRGRLPPPLSRPRW